MKCVWRSFTSKTTSSLAALPPKPSVSTLAAEETSFSSTAASVDSAILSPLLIRIVVPAPELSARSPSETTRIQFTNKTVGSHFEPPEVTGTIPNFSGKSHRSTNVYVT